ncbi:beta strand repeat-containing protein [Anaerobiospirillum succiniciproducens]|uniref:beta strand repeat-containing protein n=1 Tax=Anaerobiospirillum succiniciproducens TaxID=13335 RepID=UPI00040779B1|nr:hypothetical protein [Anaerobiospirillum succiniciproducens]
MKQTNNAIKFLMAQYRAIFKNANIAMLAAIAASALAAGQAQAVAKNFDNATLPSITDTDVTIDGTGTDAKKYKNINLTDGATSDKAFDIKVGSGGAANTIKGTVTFAQSTITVAGTAKAEAKLDIGTGAQKPTNLTLKELAVADQGTLIVAGADATNTATVTASKITFGNGKTAANSEITIDENATVTAAGDGDGEGKITINQAQVTLNAGGTLKGKEVVLTDGTVANGGTLSGSTISINGGELTNTGTLTAGTLNLSGGTLTATKAVTATDLTVSKGTLEATETVTASGDLKITDGTVNATKAVSGKNISVTGGTVDFKAATGVLGSDTSTVKINGGTVTSTKAGAIKGSSITIDKGTFTLTEGLTIGSAAGTVDVNGGKFTVPTGQKLSFVGTTNLTSGTITTTDAGELVFKGNATINGTTLTLGAKAKTNIETDATTKTSTLNVSATTFGTLVKEDNRKIKVTTTAADETAVLHFTDTDTAINLAKTSGVGVIKDDGTGLVAVNFDDKAGDGKFAVSAAKAEFKKNALAPTAAKDTVKIIADELTVGESSFTVTAFNAADSLLQVGKTLTVGDGTKDLTIAKGGIELKGAANSTGNAVSAGKITVGGGESGFLTVKAGNWEVSALDLKKGKTDIESGAGLTVNGKLSAATGTTVTVKKGGSLSTVGSGSLGFKEADDNALTVNGKLELDEGDLLDNGALNGNALKATALSGKGTIKINNGTPLKEDQFKKLQQDLSKFKGLFDVEVDIKDHDTLTTTNAFGNLKTDKYDNKSLNISGGESISKNYSVGNVVVKADEDLVLAEGGSLSLNNPQAQNVPGNFVSKTTATDTDVGNVKFQHADNTLTLAGTGKIGSITADAANKGVVDVGNTDKAGHVTVVKGNSIGTQANPISDVNVVKGSLNVESGSIFANNFAMDAGTSVQVEGDITTSLLTVDGGLLSAKTLKLEGSAKDNTIAGGANVTLDSLTMGNDQVLLVGEAGQPAQAGRAGETADLGSNAVVYTKSLMMGNTTSSIFVDPNYGTGASLFATDKIGADGSTVSGKVGIGSNSAFGVGFESMAAFKDVVGDYLTVKGGFDESGVKNALVLNKGITVAEGNGITVDAEATKDNYAKKVKDDTLTLGEGAALVLTDKAFGANKTDAAIKFADTNNSGSIVVGNKYKVVLVGDFDANDNALKLAVKKDRTDADGLNSTCQNVNR